MSPTEQVKEAIKQGKSNPADIAKATGLGQGTVEIILAHLERTAELVRESLTSCPTGGCGSCAQAGGCRAPRSGAAPAAEKALAL